MNFVFTLCCVILTAGFFAVATRTRGASPSWLLPLLFAVPAVFVSATLITSRDRFGDLHLRLLSVTFDARTGRAPSIGGDGSVDELVVERMPRRLITGRGGGSIAIDPSAEPLGPLAAEAAVVALEGGAAPGLVGARRLEAGDRFCLADCSNADAVWFTSREDAAGLETTGGESPLPRFPDGRIGAPTRSILPLRDYGASERNTAGEPGDPCTSGRHFCLPGGRPANSFLYRTETFFGSVQTWIMLLDRDAVFLPHRGTPGADRAGAPALVTLTGTGAPKRLVIYEVNFAPPEAELDDATQASRLVRRQTISIGAGASGAVRLTPARLPVETIRREALRLANGVSPQAGRRDRSITLDLVGSRHDEAELARPGNPVRIPLLGSSLLAGQEPAVLIGSIDHAPETLRVEGVTGPDGRTDGPIGVGSPFRIGPARGSGVPSALLRIEHFHIPWLAFAVTLGWALLVPIAQRRVWAAAPANAIILTALQFLLALRLLVAIGAVALDPRRGWSEPVGGALIAYVAVPLLLIALTPRPGGQPRDLLWPALFAGAVTAAVTQAFGDPGRFPLALGIVATAAGSIGAFGLPRPLGAWLKARRAAPLRRWNTVQARLASSRLVGPIISRGQRLPWWIWIIVAAVVLRVLFVLFGYRERVPLLGTNFALTIFYVPMLIVGFAGLLHEAVARPRLMPIGIPLAAVALGGLAVPGAALLLGDAYGWLSILVYSAVYLLVLAAFAVMIPRGAAQPERRGARLSPFMLASAIGLAAFGAAILLFEGAGRVLALCLVIYIILVTALAATLRARDPLPEGPPVGMGLWLMLLIALSLVIVPLLLIRDWGLAILGIAVAGFALSLARRARDRWQRGVWAAPAIAIPLFLLALTQGLPWWQSFDWRSEIRTALESPQPDEAAAARILGRISDNDNNLHRLRLILHPEQVASAGTDVAESLLLWSAQLRHYTSTRAGEGFLAPSAIGDLWAVQADDNVSAVHLIHPFGRQGAAAFLLLLGISAWAAARRSRAPPGAMRTAGALALWTLFTVGSYMVLANLQWLPFTGRNVYLLAAFSNSDLVEGAVLIWLALFGLGRRAPA